MFRNLLVAATLLSFNVANSEEIIAQKPIVCDLIEENKKIPETYNEIILFQAKNMSLDGYGGIMITDIKVYMNLNEGTYSIIEELDDVASCILAIGDNIQIGDSKGISN